MTTAIEAYNRRVTAIHDGGNLAVPEDVLTASPSPPREVPVSKLGWVIIWFKDRFMPSSTRATHQLMLHQLERTIQTDEGCPLKGQAVGGLIDRSFDRKSRNRSWLFVQRLQKVSEELRSTVDDPLLQGLDGSQMQFTMDTYPTEDNFQQMLEQTQLAHEARSKAQASDTTRQLPDAKFDENPEISREDFIQFLKYIHKNTPPADREQSKSEPQLALAAMLTYRLAFPSPTRGKRKDKGHWDRSLDGAFYGCRDMDTAARYYAQYRDYYKNRPRVKLTLEDASRELDLFQERGRANQEPPTSFPNPDNTENEISPVQVVPAPELETDSVSDSVSGSVIDESMRIYEDGIVLAALSRMSKQARDAGGVVSYNKSTSSLTTSHCSRFGKQVVRLRDKVMPGLSAAKNRAVLQELDLIMKRQFGFSKENAQDFLEREFTPEVLSDTPAFTKMLAETAGALFESKKHLDPIRGTSLEFGVNNNPTFYNFQFRASMLLPMFNAKIESSATVAENMVPGEASGNTGQEARENFHENESRTAKDPSRETRVRQEVARPGSAESRAFKHYQEAALQDGKALWEKYLDFLYYLDKNMPEVQRINDPHYKDKEADIALSVFLLHEGLDHKYASARLHQEGLAGFSVFPDQMIGHFAECHREFSEQRGQDQTW